MTRRTFPLILMLAMLAACTRLKPVTTPSPTPLPSASTAVDETPVPFPSTPAPEPSPTPTPLPKPTIVLSEPTSATDFAATSVDIAFTATAAGEQKIKSATVLFDGRVLAAFEAAGPAFRVEHWDPNQQNNLADPPVTTPVGSGDHALTIVAVDDAGTEAKVEIGIYKQLKITGWSEAASMPNPTSHHAVSSDSAVPPSFVSIWGSVDGFDTTVIPRTQVYGFTPVGNGNWTTLTTNGNSVPHAGYGFATHPSGQLFYLAGGRVGAQDLRTLDLYSPLRKVAEQALVSLGVGRTDPSAAFVDQFLYVIGGKTAGTPGYAVERVAIAADGNPTGEFARMADLQNARAGATALVQGKEIWVFGGGHRPVERYDTTTNAWSFLLDAAGQPVATPVSWSNAAMVPVNGRVFFFGGEKEDGQASDRIYEFNPTTKTWREMGPMPSITGEDPDTRALTRVAVFFHDNAFYVVGGKTLPTQRASARVLKGATL